LVERIQVRDQTLSVQAADVLRVSITSGDYAPGDRLPPESELAAQLGISRTTLRTAMSALERQGLIHRRQGLGTFVAGLSAPNLQGGLESMVSLESLAQKAGLVAKALDRTVLEVRATARWAEALNVEAGALLHQVRYTLAIQGAPTAALDTLVPEAVLSRQVLEGGVGSALATLLEHSECRPAYTNSRIFAIAASEAVAARLQVPLRQPLLYMEETYYTTFGRPVALSLNCFVTDRFNFYIGRIVP
jgi:GntR family transcriptional regulator